MLRWLSIGLAAVCCLVLFRLGVLAPRHITLNANEGWNAYHAAGVIAGQPLYPDPPRLFLTNYPPLSFFIVGAAGRLLGGDVMLAGRLLSFVAFPVWTLALALTARRLGATRDEAAFGAALFAMHQLVFADYYVGVNDPQLLAQATAGFAPLLLLREPRTNGRLAASALLFATALFVKQNLVSLPIACVVWLLRFDRPAAWRLIAFGAVFGAIGAAICLACFGPGFIEHLSTPRPTPPHWLLTMGLTWLPRLVVPLAAVLLLARRLPRDRHAAFAVTLAAVCTMVGFLEIAFLGMYWNAIFDATWALCLTAAVALNRLTPASGAASARRRAVLAAAYLAVPAAVLATSATIHWGSPRFWIDPQWSDLEKSRQEIAFLAAHPGPAMCETLSLCYWAGKPDPVDFFNMSERIGRSPDAAEPLLRQLESRRFAVIQIDETHDMGARVGDLLKREYTIDHQGRWGTFLVPRER